MWPSEITDSPSWGAFPAEQYLLQNWEWGLQETDNEQRKRLIRDYIQVLDGIPRAWDTIRELNRCKPQVVEPSQRHIEVILAPWRSPDVRLAAAKLWVTGPTVQINVIRTYYAPSSSLERAADDRRLLEWIETALEDANPPYDTVEEASRWLFLGDQDVFKVDQIHDEDQDWRWQGVIMETLPELFGPFDCGYGDSMTRLVPSDPRSGVVTLKLWRARHDRLRQEVAAASSYEERLSAIEAGDEELQHMCIDNVVMVADKQAFETGSLLAVFLDSRGHETRSSRRDAHEDWWSLRADIFGGASESNPWWNGETEGSRKGDKYGPRSEIGTLLYGVEDLLEGFE